MSQQPQQPPNTIVVASRDDAESSSGTDETTPLQSGMAAPPANYLASADNSNGSSGSGDDVSVVPAPSASIPAASPSPDVAASPSSPDEETSGKDVEPVLDAADRAALDPHGPSVPAGQEADGAGVPSSVAGSDAEGQRLMDHENPSLKQVVGLESPPASSGPAKPDTIEAGTAGMTHEQLLAIAARFKPVVWLHSQERYLPTTISMYLQRVRLGYDADWAPDHKADPATYVWLKDAPTEDDLTDEGLFKLLEEYKNKSGDKRLANLTRDNVIKRAFHMQLKKEQHHTGVSSFAEINSVPFYSRVRKYADHWEVLYITMYAYNGPYNVCGFKCEPHSADVEHVTVRTNADATKLEWCYFGAHGRADGVWRQEHEIEVLPGDMSHPTRPVVYSAQSSHATYPKSGYWCRILGFASDWTTGAKAGSDAATAPNRWDPPAAPVLLYDPSDARYPASLLAGNSGTGGLRLMEYNGTLGEDGVDAFRNQGWWDAENEYQNNCFRRGFWVCRYCSCNNDMCYNACQRKVDFSKPPPNKPAAQTQMER